MEGTSRTLPYTIRFVGLLGSHSLGRNPKFMATAVDLGREFLRQKIKLAYGGGSVGLQGAVASTVFTNGGLIRGFIPGYKAIRRVYGPTYGVEHTVSSNYYKYFEMNHAVEAFIVLPGGVDTIEGLFTLISWASEGLHNRPIGLLNIDGYFNNLLKFLDDAVRQNFMASSQRKLFISSFFVDELLDKLEFVKAFPGPGVSYDEFVNPGRLDFELHQVISLQCDFAMQITFVIRDVMRFFFSDLRFRSRGYLTPSRSKIAEMDGTDDEMDFSSAPSTPNSYESELEYVFDEIRIEKKMEMLRERLAAYYKPKEDEPKEVKKKEDEDDDDTQSESYEYEEGDDVLWEYFISDPKRRYKDF
ncbi:hypothetical protein DM860_011824 [Cuscuta australis]|uniref:cytokinin riboside 5'-monophosphate phosphoribohydrolase n=1 Tax=Cuscuta australis TaxID=267555 RepID=A0A328DFP5_9ASTE|nr:hypothetical protein DM860_011824 [Cuscuta australis]